MAIRIRSLFGQAVILTIFVSLGLSQASLVSQRIRLKDGKTFSLNIPRGYEIIPAAEGLKRVRFFAKAPDGRLFVTGLYNLADNKRGAIYILDGWDERTGKFSKIIPYMTRLHNPNSVQFYRDPSRQDWIYIAETGKLTRRNSRPARRSRPTQIRRRSRPFPTTA